MGAHTAGTQHVLIFTLQCRGKTVPNLAAGSSLTLSANCGASSASQSAEPGLGVPDPRSPSAPARSPRLASLTCCFRSRRLPRACQCEIRTYRTWDPAGCARSCLFRHRPGSVTRRRGLALPSEALAGRGRPRRPKGLWERRSQG